MFVLTILIALIGATCVFGQAAHTAPGYSYQGCSDIDLSCFTQPMVLPGGRVTPETCQDACKAFKFAALVNEACLCGNDETAIKPTDEGCCDHCCMNDDSLGMCGNSCPEENPGVANVYAKSPALEQYSQVQPPPPPPPPASTSCPEEPTVVESVVPPSAPAVYSETTVKAATVAPSPSAYQAPPPPPSQYQTPDGEAPEPQAYATSSAEIAPTSSCSTTTSDCSVPDPEVTPAYQTTFLPSTSQAYGTPPVPSQVPSSDGVCFVPSFSAIGGLALIAIMII